MFEFLAIVAVLVAYPVGRAVSHMFDSLIGEDHETN